MSGRRIKQTALLLTLVICGLAAWVYYVPFPYALLSRDNLSSTRIVDRHGRPLREALNPDEGRARRIDAQGISEYMRLATVHAEDERFWSHHGVDPVAIGRAAWQNLTNLEVVSGASTITQQVVKMVALQGRERTLLTKLEEAVLAIRLDKMVRKRSIMTEYLLRAPYGNQLFGVGAAARMYFDKPASQLTLAESALLAGIPRAPSLNNPYVDMQRAQKVQRQVLELMLEREAISPEQFERAINEQLVIHPRRGRVLAAHFTEHVLETIEETIRPQKVETTLDLDLQRRVRGIVRSELSRLEGRDVGQAAVVVLDTDTAEVLAWVGSRDYWDEEAQGANDGVTALRQPGSALKPFVYGLYLDGRGTAADMLPDFPLQFPGQDGAYIPKNYDRHYHGPVGVRDALASSLNIPAVVVAERVGVEAMRQKLRELGLTTLDADAEHYGLGLALGNGEVRLLDLAAAYATLGHLGEVQKPRIVRRASTSSPAPEDPKSRAFTSQTSYTLLDILADDFARARGFGRFSALHLPYRVAAKTGTSANFRDNWAVGVTPDYTVAVWAGNFDGSPMRRSSGVTGAAPIMRQVFQTLYPQAANAADVAWFEAPEALEEHTVCALSGQRPTKRCASHRMELFTGDEWASREPCQIHRELRVDRRTGLLATDACPVEVVERRDFLDVPDTWTEWALERGWQLAPTRPSPLCGEDEADASSAVAPRILHPLDGDTFVIDPTLPAAEQQVALRAAVGANRRHETLTWFVDGEPVARVDAPFQTFWRLQRGAHVIGLGGEVPETTVRLTVR